ncbi:DUF1746-domain-containing protein [Polyplosphaeria fusca]|uniref:DUF1746-domain-containing protein n=1 Tax=Polyplosphaeria fusca TaxID=682080 RepID=A0A9P4QPK1_9PLEO|nr:DUF1746-domain-containing protein [Polyplosphaeria fusca]
MNDEPESSRTGDGYGHADASSDHDHHEATREHDDEEDAARREQTTKERRIDAKRKRITLLDSLLRELDSLVFLEHIAIYHLDCSFFWFLARSIVHTVLLTPLPDLTLSRQYDDHKPFSMLVVLFAINFLLHVLYPAPSGGEETRGYLHGGLMIDFIGQQGPTSKWKLATMDVCVLVIQLVMMSVHVKRRDLKKKLAKVAAGPSASTAEANEDEGAQASTAVADAEREQDADAEESGRLRRTDTLSDIGADLEEDDALLPGSSDSGHVDALDVLSSGQCVIGDFHVIDTLVQEHERYRTHTPQARASSLSPTTLRQLHTIRVRFGVGGG